MTVRTEPRSSPESPPFNPGPRNLLTRAVPAAAWSEYLQRMEDKAVPVAVGTGSADSAG